MQASRVQELHRNLVEAFLVFEHEEGSKRIDEKDLPTVIRSVGINLSNAQVDHICQELKASPVDDEDVELIFLNKFEKVMARYLAEAKDSLVRDDYHKVLRAFRCFDPEGRGYIEPDQLQGLVTQKGEQFDAQEVANMLGCAIDPATGRVYYEDYAYLLANDGRVQ